MTATTANRPRPAAHEAARPTPSARTAGRPATVTVVVRNEVVRQGVRAVLRRLPTAAGDPCVEVVMAGPSGSIESEGAGPPRSGPGSPVLQVVDAHEASTLSGAEPDSGHGVVVVAELSVATLGDILRRLAAGPPVLPQVRTDPPTAAGTATEHAWPVSLTARERQTLRLLADGMSNKEVARALGVSFDCAKRLVSTVILKLGAANRTTAVVQGIVLGLLDASALP